MECSQASLKRIRFHSLAFYRGIGMKNKSFLAVQTRWESTRVDLDDILLIERRLRKVFLVTSERLISYYDKIKHIEPLLGENYMKLLDGCFINLERMESAKEGILRFDTGFELPVSSRNFAKAKRSHHSYYRTRQLRESGEAQGESN